MAAVFVVTFIAGFTLAAASRSQPEPVSAAAGARTAAVPTTPYTGGMEVQEDGPAEPTTKGCAP